MWKWCLTRSFIYMYIHIGIKHFYWFSEKGKEMERKKHLWKRKHWSAASRRPPLLGIEPHPGCVMNSNGTCHSTVHRMIPNQLSNTGQGPSFFDLPPFLTFSKCWGKWLFILTLNWPHLSPVLFSSRLLRSVIFLKIIVIEMLLFLFQNSSDLSTPEPFPAFLTRKRLLQISPEFQILHAF